MQIWRCAWRKRTAKFCFWIHFGNHEKNLASLGKHFEACWHVPWLLNMVTTWYALDAESRIKLINCLFSKNVAVACITVHLLGIKQFCCVQSISQSSLSSCECDFCIFLFVFCAVTLPAPLLLYASLHTVLLRAYQPSIAWYCRFGRNSHVTLWQPMSIKQARQPPAKET